MIPHLIDERLEYISAHCPMCQFPFLIRPANERPFPYVLSTLVDRCLHLEAEAVALRRQIEEVLP